MIERLAKVIRSVGERMLACNDFVELRGVTLDCLEDALKATSSCMGLAYADDDGRRLHRLYTSAPIPAGDLLRYEEVLRPTDPVVCSMMPRHALPAHRLVVLDRLVDMRAFADTPLYRGFLKPHAVHHVLGISTALDERTQALFGLHRPESPGDRFSEREIEVARALLPLLNRSFAQMLLHERLSDREAIIQTLVRSGSGEALIALDESLRILFIDDTATQYLRRLHCAERSLHLTRRVLPHRLRAQVAAAVTGIASSKGVQLIDLREVGRDRSLPKLALTVLAPANGQARYLLKFQAKRSPGSTSVPSTLAGLTCREAEVAQLAASGLTSSGIATRLHLSPRTVDNHLRCIYRKLQVRNRVALANILHRVLDTH